MIEMKEWDGFEGRLWKEEINVRQFIQDNYTPYDGVECFLGEPRDGSIRNYRKKSVPSVAFLIWRQRL